MKKAYVLLIVILLVVTAAFIYAKIYINNLEARDTEIRLDIHHKVLVDSLHHVYERMNEQKTVDLRRAYDSLRVESEQLLYALESQLDLYLFDQMESDEDQNVEVSDDAGLDTLDNADEAAVDSAYIKPIEYEIYIAYLERIMDLPPDLSDYERRVAVREVKSKLENRYEMSEKELKSLLIKLRTRDDHSS